MISGPLHVVADSSNAQQRSVLELILLNVGRVQAITTICNDFMVKPGDLFNVGWLRESVRRLLDSIKDEISQRRDVQEEFDTDFLSWLNHLIRSWERIPEPPAEEQGEDAADKNAAALKALVDDVSDFLFVLFVLSDKFRAANARLGLRKD